MTESVSIEKKTPKTEISCDSKKPSRVVMIYPEQGVSGVYVRHMPLSLLYASVELVQNNFDVKNFQFF